MIKAWTFHGQETTALLVAAGSAPPLAVAVHQVFALGPPVSYDLQGLAGIAVAFLAVEASSRLVGWGRFLTSRALLLFLSVTLQAVVAGLGLSWLAFLMLPTLGPGLTGALVVGLCTAAVAAGVRWILPLLSGTPTAMTGNVLVLGREDLAGRLSRELFHRGGAGGASELAAGDPRNPLVSEIDVDPVKLRQLVQREEIGKIVVVEPDPAAREHVTAALLECRLLGVEVVDAIELYQRMKGKIWLEALDPERLVYSDGFRITPLYRFLKRIFDVACALAVLVLAAPLIAAIAIAVKLESRGPVLFRQERVGQFGKPFTLLKFRSMRVDAESDGPVWARKNDDRVTRIGGLLRRLHLDELPQVVNVLKGDLSFVGPRPERPCFVEMLREEIPYYHLRHYVKPGVTGWAQVSYPYADSIEDSYEKLEYDLYYAREASLGLDLKILFRTAVHIVTTGGR